MSKTTSKCMGARILVLLMSFLIVFTGIVFGAFGGITKAYAEGAISWSDLDSSGGDGKTQIEFVSGGKLGNMLQGAERIDKYINTSDIQNGLSIVLPSSEDAGQPFRYKDNDDNKNYYLAGWALVPNKSEYENGDGTYHTLKNLRYFKPGETVHIDNSFVNSTGTIMFYPDWQPISYNYGSEDDTALGGLRDDVYDGKAIRSDLYDYNSLLVNLLNSHIGPKGNWNDNHTGLLFIDGEYSQNPTIQRPNDKWTVETEPGYKAVVNEWTGGGGGAAQGLWDLANLGMLFDESTPGVNYVGNADNGPMYWYDNNENSPYYGYYVYDSDQSAAVYNQSQQRFYVYNNPQKGTGWKEWKGFLPFNKARDTAYSSFANGDDAPNYHFGMVTQVDFFLTGDVADIGANRIKLENDTVKDMEFYFSGDDDVYVFVDDKLALDIGGIHDAVSGSINFATGEVKTKRSNGVGAGVEVTNPDSIKDLKAGNHRLTIYYMERGSNETNNLTAFCLVLPATLKVQKLDKDTGEPVIYPGAEFYLQNKKGEYYHLDEVTDPDDPLQVPKVSYTSDKTGAYKFVADEDGAVTIKYVADGEYVLTEVGAPEYYEGLPGAFSFEVENAKIVEKSLKFYQDNDYSGTDKPYTEDPDWSDNISIDGDKVTLNVSNERKTLPFDLLKDFLDGKNPEGVPFVVKEHWDIPTKKVGDKTVVDTTKLPLDKAPEDVTRIVYEGTANSEGKVTNYTYYPLGKDNTAEDRIKTGLSDLTLKQGAVYYIEENYSNDNYYELKTPIVVYTDEENVYLLSDPDDSSLKVGPYDVKVLQEDEKGKIDDSKLKVSNVPKIEEEPEKKINGGTALVLLKNRDEVFTYTVSQKIPAGATEVTFEDTLEKVLEVKEASIDVEGVDVAVNGQKVTASIDDKEVLKGLVGKTVTLTIKAKIKADATDAELDAYTNRTIPNEATVSINGNGKTTNKVEVTPPPEEPEKKINGQKDTVELDNRDDDFTYTVSQKIPAGATEVTFEDTLEDVLEVKEASIDVEGIKAEIDDQKVSASINDKDVLKGLVGKTVTLTIVAKIKEGVTDELLLAKYAQTTDIPNTANVSINDNGKSTNTVLVTPPPEEEDPIKKVNGEAGTVALEGREDEFTYTVVQKVPANATTVTFEDELEDVLEVVSVEMVDAKASYENQSDLDKNIVKFHTKDAKADRGNTVTLKVVAKIKEGVTDVELVNKYGDIYVPNTAKVTINNNPKTTNEVIVTPPEEPTEEPEKKINGQKDKVTLERRYETFVYTVEQKIPAKAVNVVFEDTLEDVLEVVGTPTINVMGVEPVVNGQNVTATIEDATSYRGQTVVLTIMAKIKNSATEADLDAYTDRSIPNKATVTIDDNGKVTNEVLVTPPPVVPEDPVKKVNGSEKAYLANRDEEFTYTVSQRIPANAVNVVFEDTLEDVLEVVGTPDIDADGAEVDVEGQKVTATISDATNLEDKIVTLTIKARIKESATEEELDTYTNRRIPNKATVTINGNGKVTNEVIVIPPEIPGEPEKFVNGTKELVELNNRGEEFTYTIVQSVPIGAKTMTFKDTLEDVLEIIETGIDADGEAIVITTSSDTEDATEEADTPKSEDDPADEEQPSEEEETNDEATDEEPVTVVPEVDGQTVTAFIPDCTDLEGKVITLTIKAKISDMAAESAIDAYADRTIPNKATVEVYPNHEPMVTNTVFVKPPKPEQPDPEKKINGSTDLLELAERNLPFTYTVSQVIPVGAVDVVFEDELENVLEVIDASIDVAGVEAVINGQRVKATIEDARALAGSTVTLTISAKIKDSATNLELEKYTDRKIPNVAKVSIDGNGKVTNEVLVTPPKVVTEDPIKKVNGQDKVKLSKRNEVFTYTITQMVPLGSSTVKIEDTLEDVLEVVGKPEIDVEDVAVKVNGQTVTAEIKDAKACEGRIIVLTIKARIKTDATDEDLAAYTNLEIPNVATVVLDNYVNATNEVIVTPPTVVESEYRNDEKPKTEKHKTEVNDKPEPDKTVVKGVNKINTGDGQGIVAYIMFALAAAVAMSVMITLRKRRDNA